MGYGFSALSEAVRSRLSFWGPLLARFFWLQAVSQLLAIAAGLIIVRGLKLESFAIYTIAVAVQTTAAILADSGITQSLMARGGAVAGDPRRFTEVINTALHLRRRLETVTLALALPVLLYLLHANASGWTAAILAAGAVSLAVHASIDQTIFSTVLMLQLRPLDAQRGAVASAALRLGLVVAVLLFHAQWLAILWIGAVALTVQGWLVRRSARAQLIAHAEISQVDREAMLIAFRNQVLNGIYFALQPQITVWAITVFGSVQKIAEVGALGRLAIAFALVSSAFGSIALPRFARSAGARTVRRSYFLLAGAMVLIGAAAVGGSALFPRLILSILGSKYLHLESELVWMVAASAMSVVASALYLLNTSRGWVQGIWVGVPAAILAQLLVGWLVDLSTVRGAIVLQMSSIVASLAVSAVVAFRGMRQMTDTPSSALSAPGPAA
jgi:hypothetical protein